MSSTPTRLRIRHLGENQPDFWRRLEKIARGSSLFDPEIEARTRAIIEAVREEGDSALSHLTAKFDGAELSAKQFRLTRQELTEASRGRGRDLLAALKHAQQNIATFSKRSLRKNWAARNLEGGMVGEKFEPFERVGIYIPGGSAPLISTALMTVTLARVAGCPQIVVCTPCDRTGQVNPDLAGALELAGATEVYRLGGAQAIAAMALGTRTIAPVQKVFGPGNAYVVAAKRLLFGYVAVDLLPGPSELLVLGDQTANARYVAADLLAQAEHGSGHERLWLVSASPALLTAVEKEMARQLAGLPRAEAIARALAQNGCFIAVNSLESAIAVANKLAPEHCEIMTRNAHQVGRRIQTAGSIFLGPYSPTVLGDYVAGPSHVLPTGSAARSFSGLTADQFQRRTSLIKYSKSALGRATFTVRTLAGIEGLQAHAHSADIRLESRRGGLPGKTRSAAGD